MSTKPTDDGGESIPAGVGSFRDRKDQSIEDPFRVNGAEFLSAALPDSCQAAIQSDTQRDTVGLEEESVRELTQREKEKDPDAAAMLISQGDVVWARDKDEGMSV